MLKSTQLIIILLGLALALIILGLEKGKVALKSGKSPITLSLEEIQETGVSSSWVKIGPHKVDWDKVLISYADTGYPEKKISSVIYPLRSVESGHEWKDVAHIVLVRSEAYSYASRMEKGITVMSNLEGIFSGSLKSYARTLKAELTSTYPDLDLEKVLLFHEGHKPSSLGAILMLAGGLLCGILGLLLILSSGRK